jgi:hypothetical protein
MSPADRDAEANFRAQLAEWRHESSRLAAKAARYKEEVTKVKWLERARDWLVVVGFTYVLRDGDYWS